jgi:mannose-1-phosphate guanylyltransferase
VKAHERFYAEELADVKSSRVVVQPSNKGTTAAIISSLQRITSLAGDPIVGFFPTDHYYSREARFVTSVRLALQIASSRLETIILLGAVAKHPEAEYGWIEPGTGLECPLSNSLCRVRRFWEKPSTQVAQTLHARGCLWNAFVMIGRASAFLNILKAAAPGMLRALGADHGQSEAQRYMANADKAHAALTPGDFSRQVLSVSTEQLAVLPMGNVGWSDLGTPERAMVAMARYGLSSDRHEFTQHEYLEDLAKTPVF